MIELYEKKIKQYRVMYDICVDLLKFEHGEDMKKYRLYKFKVEVADNGNNNRIKAAEREVKKATYDEISLYDVDEMVAKVLKESVYSDEVHEYKSFIRDLKNIGPKEYIVKCLQEIVVYKDRIEEVKKQEMSKKQVKEEKKKTTASIKTTPVKSTSNKISINDIKLGKTLKEIIRNHLRNNNPYLEKKEVQQIKEEFKIDLFKDNGGYLSNNTIEKLFTVRIVTEQMDRNQEVHIKGLVDAIDALYELALAEMPYKGSSKEYGTQGSVKYETALYNIKPVINRDYVNEYAILYEKVKAASHMFSQEERELLSKYIQFSKLMRGEKELPTPEGFRKKVNKAAKAKLSWGMATYSEPYEIANQIDNYLRYMTAEELAIYYRELRENNKSEKLQTIFVSLIGRRMSPIDIEMTKEEQIDELDRRYKSICSEYLKEEPLSTRIKNTSVRANYAKSNIEINAAKDRINKRYFNENKSIKIKYKKLKEKSRLKNFEKQGILTGQEIEEVKGLGR